MRSRRPVHAGAPPALCLRLRTGQRIAARERLGARLVLLGQGNDSHLASLFPGALGVEAAFYPRSNALVCTMTPPPGMK
ncbi:MAG: 6-phosphogluconolactonase, partial [Methylibium sp.]|nr:6-phosphogluconolactonase [Methylibium sp.]